MSRNAPSRNGKQGRRPDLAGASAALFALAALFLSGCSPAGKVENGLAASLPETVDFNFHVRPILSDRCFFCHGPDEEERKAGLRLDTEEGALAHVLDSGGRAFVAGDVAGSEAYRRMRSKDPEEVMPPPDSNLSISEYEAAVIEKWIRQGAAYKRHWAYVPPELPPVPEVKGRVVNPIDAFVQKRLEREGLALAPEADRESLIRRATFDLTGLPPTLEEIDAFLNDASSGAYETLIDGLLARESYGERMAVEWMDVARFADTHGYSMDFYRDMSPWRDWVIGAFNRNMPFDQFATWQMAGDLLPRPTKEQRLATAFNRLHPQNGEGGIVNEEFLTEYAADRVQTLGTAFLGATMECARCHDHKYDPIRQEEFYSLASFFNNVDESGQISFDPDDMPVPTMLLPTESEEERLAELERKIEAQELKRAEVGKASRAAFESWRKLRPLAERDLMAVDALTARFPFDEDDSSAELGNAVDASAPGYVAYGANIKKTEGPPLEIVASEGRQAVRLSGDDPLYFPSATGFRRSQPFTVSIDAWIPLGVEEGALFHYNKAGILYNYKGFEVSLKDGHWEVRLAHTFPYNSIWLMSKEPVAKERWQKVALVYDGSSKASGARLYVDGEAVEMDVLRDNLYKEFRHNRESVLKEIGIKVGGRWRSKGLPGGMVDELRVYDRALTPLEVAWLGGRSDALENASEADLEALYLAVHDDAYRRESAALSALRTEYSALKEGVREVMVMEEMPEPRQAYFLVRGAYDAKSHPVEPGVPASMGTFSPEWPRNRLGIAKWLTSPDHPLTARVTINRYWQLFFGDGFVATPEDFGSQGSLPNYPEVLDWLSRSFVDSGWDVKKVLKTIVMSATYRQTSRCSPDLLARDPENRLLARGPRQRLSAEMLRDNALAASGLLVRTLGGPSVYPYQPEGLWKMNKGNYEQGKGDELYRRSMYTIWKRSVPPPSMNSFDAPTRAYCVPRRQQTSTPLQALNLMNDPQFVEAARVLAEQVVVSLSDQDSRLVRIYRLLTSRLPSEPEREALRSMLAEAQRSFAAEPQRAETFLSVGERPFSREHDQVELAAYGVVASMVMNHDATVIKR